jgi:CoA-substrate-specific enzyme activase, putative
MFAGIDIGSSSTNVVFINSKKEIICYEVIPTSPNHKESAQKAISSLCEKNNLLESDITYIVSTGYGRKNVNKIAKDVTEISCHAKGAIHFYPQVRTVLDIGGQDSKVIKVNEHGRAEDFIMNEKCAAGTGRFLEAMARILDVRVDQMGKLSTQATKEIKLSSVCTVFAESEVISKIAEENTIADIIDGIHDSVCCRTVALLEKAKIDPLVVMTGGVAKNSGLVCKLEKYIGQKIYVPPEPQIVGALGAALIALEEYEKRGESIGSEPK